VALRRLGEALLLFFDGVTLLVPEKAGSHHIHAGSTRASRR